MGIDDGRTLNPGVPRASMGEGRIRRHRAAGVVVATSALVTWPVPASAHPLVGAADAPLPLELYLAGAGLAVALSFVIGFVYAGRARPAEPGVLRRVPRAVFTGIRLIGLFAWTWVIAQAVVGGSTDAEVGRLFTWVYGWVGLAIVCALFVPLWDWLDSFVTLYALGTRVMGGGRVKRWHPRTYPARFGHWPAVVGFAVFVWMELVHRDTDMDVVVVGYTAITLTGMVVFGQASWRQGAEVFSVWFGLLNWLARYGSAGPQGSGLVRRQRFPDGLVGRPWDPSLVSLVAIATGAILYDGLSQTEVFVEVFGTPDLAGSTLLLAAFLGAVVGLALVVGTRIGMTAIGAGLLPVSVGYLVAHYLTYLLGDGQRILVAVADPLQLGWDLTGTAFFVPSVSWLPASTVWVVVFVAVVGGHLLGAWAGHHGVGIDVANRARGRGCPDPARAGDGRTHHRDAVEPRPGGLRGTSLGVPARRPG